MFDKSKRWFKIFEVSSNKFLLCECSLWFINDSSNTASFFLFTITHISEQILPNNFFMLHKNKPFWFATVCALGVLWRGKAHPGRDVFLWVSWEHRALSLTACTQSCHHNRPCNTNLSHYLQAAELAITTVRVTQISHITFEQLNLPSQPSV